MERWASNTLRTLGIIFTAGIVLLGSALLLLLSMCSFSGGFGGGRNPDQGYSYIFATVVLVVVGIFLIIKLARGIRSETLPPATAIPSTPSQSSAPTADQRPLHFSPASRAAINHVVYVLIAQLVVNVLRWVDNQFHIFTRPDAFFHYPYPILASLPPFVLYQIPSLVLIALLLRRPGRSAVSYALVLPCVSFLYSLFNFSLVYRFGHSPIVLSFLLLAFSFDIVIFVLACKVLRRTGIHPEPASLVVAAVITFIYLALVQAVTPFFYRLLHT